MLTSEVIFRVRVRNHILNSPSRVDRDNKIEIHSIGRTVQLGVDLGSHPSQRAASLSARVITIDVGNGCEWDGCLGRAWLAPTGKDNFSGFGWSGRTRRTGFMKMLLDQCPITFSSSVAGQARDKSGPWV